jgi:hypothetical protein
MIVSITGTHLNWGLELPKNKNGTSSKRYVVTHITHDASRVEKYSE